MFNSEAFAKMKKGARLLNFSRGELVDENDVCVKYLPERLTNRSIRDIIERYGKTDTINQDEKE